MLAAGSIALYAGQYDTVPTSAAKKQPKKAPFSPSFSKHHLPSDSSSSMEQLSSASIADFLGPAVNSRPYPPNPRPLTAHMKRVSHSQRHHGHRTVSSESSSASSVAPLDRTPWDSTLDNLSLGRRSSTRSNDSGAPSRDRPESTHNFGRGFFHRRGKSNRDSNAHVPPSSLYSGDVTTESSRSAVGAKEALLPSIFFRRKSSSDEAAQKRPQISHPFNFQHLAHTKHHNPATEPLPAALQLSGPHVSGALESGAAPSGLPRSMSHDSLGGSHNGLGRRASVTDSARPPLAPSRLAAAPGPRRLLKQMRSQDQLGQSRPQPPPRPSRPPPAEPTSGLPFFGPPPPLPPRRTSSCQFNHGDLPAALDSIVDVRGMTDANLARQLPLHASLLFKEDAAEQLGRPGSVGIAHFEQPPSPRTDERRFSSAMSAARDSAWPLTMSTPLIGDSSLPDVPEEEEHHGPSRRSRLSLASNPSSLRGVQSVPTLPCLAETHRRPSAASETLGDLDMMEMKRLVYADAQSPTRLCTPARESWEDLIDYCYDHEAEANCDYEWERPSIDMSRDSIAPDITALAASAGKAEPEPSAVSPRAQLPPSSSRASEVPSLSPASNTSSARFESEAGTPNPIALHNFSLPRGDRKNRNQAGAAEDERSSAHSTFRESQTFIISPSFLIPREYHQNILQQRQAERQEYGEYDEPMVESCRQSAFHDDAAVLSLENNSSFPLTGQRTSTSTTATGSTSRSNSIGRQFRSTNSSRTTLTRRTTSSSSLRRMAGALTEDSEPLPAAALPSDDAQEEGRASMISPTPSTAPKKCYHKSYASESHVRNDAARAGPVGGSRPQRRRAHTHTTTGHLGAPLPPPVGQYALFPRVQATVIGDHI